MNFNTSSIFSTVNSRNNGEIQDQLEKKMHNELMFVGVLMQAATSKDYIVDWGNVGIANYQLTSDKNAQYRMITRNIADIAQRCFLEFSTIQEKGKEGQLKYIYMQALKEALKSYSKRLNSSKRWYERIAAFFGFKSKEEKRLDQVRYDASNYLAERRRYLEKDEFSGKMEALLAKQNGHVYPFQKN